jgi:hypothetical protein
LSNTAPPQQQSAGEEEDNEAREVRPASAKNLKQFESTHDKVKYALNANCEFTFLKKNLIDRLNNNYVLVNHPFPTLEGELLIYQYPDPKNIDSSS